MILRKKNKRMINTLLREINVIIAFLLLTGKISITAIFVEPSGFGIVLGGPITGSRRLKGNNRLTDNAIDLFDFIIAILLIANKIGIIGIFVSSRRFTIVVSGPIFGHNKTVVDWKIAKRWKSLVRLSI